MPVPKDIVDLLDQLDANEREAREIVAGLDEERGRWQPQPGAWSVAECLDHLAKADRVYLDAMREPAQRARAANRLRRRAAKPGALGAWFVRTLEPPVKAKMKTPGKIRPTIAPPLRESVDAFLAAHRDVREFLEASADLDLASIHFRNPFVPLLRWSLATGFNVLAAHARRHLSQARRVRDAATGRQRQQAAPDEVARTLSDPRRRA
jgi:hypothetical protein